MTMCEQEKEGFWVRLSAQTNSLGVLLRMGKSLAVGKNAEERK